MSAQPIYYTQEGYNELVAELDYLKNTRRAEVIQDIERARGFGDLSENAEYDAARNAQAENEARILKLKFDIEHAEIYDASKAVRGVIDIGSTVKVYDEVASEELTFRIVGSNEAAPLERKISDQSPIGRALMGKRAGDRISVTTPAGERHFLVREVARATH